MLVVVHIGTVQLESDLVDLQTSDCLDAKLKAVFAEAVLIYQVIIHDCVRISIPKHELDKLIRTKILLLLDCEALVFASGDQRLAGTRQSVVCGDVSGFNGSLFRGTVVGLFQLTVVWLFCLQFTSTNALRIPEISLVQGPSCAQLFSAIVRHSVAQKVSGAHAATFTSPQDIHFVVRATSFSNGIGIGRPESVFNSFTADHPTEQETEQEGLHGASFWLWLVEFWVGSEL